MAFAWNNELEFQRLPRWKSFKVFHICRNPTWRECEDETHIPEMGTWEFSRTFEILEFDRRGQKPSHWGVLYIIGKLSKCRCLKWVHMGHLDICNTSYGKKKGRESNWQFNSRPLKVRNRPDPGTYRWSATHRWKALKERYKFSWDFIPIGDLNKELWFHKVPGVQTGIVLGLLLGSPEAKNHSDVGATERHIVYYMGEVVVSPESGPWWVLWVQICLWFILTPRVLQNLN
jgi:hypothetical protein